MNNTVSIKSVLTGIFLILTFLPALEVRALGQSASAPGVGNQIGDEAIATEEVATTAVMASSEKSDFRYQPSSL